MTPRTTSATEIDTFMQLGVISWILGFVLFIIFAILPWIALIAIWSNTSKSSKELEKIRAILEEK